MAPPGYSQAMLRGGSMKNNVEAKRGRKYTKRIVIMLIVVVVIAVLLIGWGVLRAFFIAKFLTSFANQTQTVATITAQEQPWQSRIQSVGTLTAINGAALSAEVSGIVATIDFRSGEDVQKGDVLLTLRPNNDPAVLAQLQAQARLASINYERDAQQFAAKAVSRAQLDTDRANLDSADAQVAAQEAAMAEKVVRAPFSGRLGIRQVDIGQYLAAGTKIVTLEQLNPLFVDFYLPQQDLPRLAIGQKVELGLDTYPSRLFPATITAIGAALTQDTRSIAVRAELQNPDAALRPGMFTAVFVDVGAVREAVTLPQTAIAYNSYGDTVYTVEHGKDVQGHETLLARQVFVTLGATRGDQVQVLSGIEPGTQIVIAGQMKLHNGSPLAINNSVLPGDTPNPNPPNE